MNCIEPITASSLIGYGWAFILFGLGTSLFCLIGVGLYRFFKHEILKPNKLKDKPL